jgi:hypothetical protein
MKSRLVAGALNRPFGTIRHVQLHDSAEVLQTLLWQQRRLPIRTRVTPTVTIGIHHGGSQHIYHEQE